MMGKNKAVFKEGENKNYNDINGLWFCDLVVACYIDFP